MADPNIVYFQCLNPECAKPIRMRRPLKSGIYTLTCPYCGFSKKFNLKGMDAYEGTNQGQPQQQQTPQQGPQPQTEQQPPQQPKVPDFSKAEPISLEEDFFINEACKFTCRHCNKQEMGFNTPNPGKREFECPYCHGRTILLVRDKTKSILTPAGKPMANGRLVLLKKGWFNTKYTLSPGSYTIGRFDNVVNSDIAVKNDPTMSRRSVKIEVIPSEKGNTFKLTVLKSTNPVLHNDEELPQGDSVSLAFGDTIVLGKTRFRFEKDE